MGGQTGSEITNPALGDNLGALLKADPMWFFQKIIPNLITLAFTVAILIFFFMLITGAIQWISSGGDKQGLEGARGKLSNALIGLVILLSMFALMKLIETFFGVSILTLDIGALKIK